MGSDKTKTKHNQKRKRRTKCWHQHHQRGVCGEKNQKTKWSLSAKSRPSWGLPGRAQRHQLDSFEKGWRPDKQHDWPHQSTGHIKSDSRGLLKKKKNRQFPFRRDWKKQSLQKQSLKSHYRKDTMMHGDRFWRFRAIPIGQGAISLWDRPISYTDSAR